MQFLKLKDSLKLMIGKSLGQEYEMIDLLDVKGF